MIRYALQCAGCGGVFEAWFASSSSFEDQHASGKLACIHCGGPDVAKQIMAPAVKTRAKADAKPPELSELIKATRDHIGKTHDYVGEAFPDEARAMHYGEIDTRPIWGEATPDAREALEEEGVDVAPLPPPLVPDKPVDPSKMN